MSPTTEFELDVLAFPTVTAAAEMLGIDKATVSKAGLDLIQSGATKRVQPRDVLQLGMQHRKRPLTQVAGSLLSFAEQHGAEAVSEVEAQIHSFFAEARQGGERRHISRDEFLAEAARFLTEDELRKIERRYDEAVQQAGRSIPVVSGFKGGCDA